MGVVGLRDRGANVIWQGHVGHHLFAGQKLHLFDDIPLPRRDHGEQDALVIRIKGKHPMLEGDLPGNQDQLPEGDHQLGKHHRGSPMLLAQSAQLPWNRHRAKPRADRRQPLLALHR